MQQYFECVGLIPGNLAENEVQPVLEEVTGFFNKVKAEIVRNELIGRRKMAYPIDNMRHAYYFLIGFNIDGEKIGEIEKQLKLYNNVMRFLVTKHAPKTTEQIKKEQERLARQTGERADGEKSNKPERKKEQETRPVETTKEKVEARKAVEEKIEAKKTEAVNVEELDKKLDEILDEEIKS